MVSRRRGGIDLTSEERRKTGQPVERSDEAPVFDAAGFLEYLQGDRELFDEAVAAFRGDIPRRIAELGALMELGELEGVAAQAHSLKGAAGTLAAPGVRNAALALEQDCRNGCPDLARTRFQQLCRELTTLLAVLEKCG